MNLVLRQFQKFFFYFKTYKEDVGFPLYLYSFLSFIKSFTEGISFVALIPLVEQVRGGEPDSFVRKILNFLGVNPDLISILITVALVFLLKGLLSFAVAGYQHVITSNTQKRVRRKILNHISKMSFAYYVRQNSGYLINLISNESGRYVGSFKIFCDIINTSFHIIVLLTAAYALNANFTLASIGFGAFVLVVLKLTANFFKKISLEKAYLSAVFSELFISSVQSFKYLSVTSKFEILKTKITKKIDKIEILSIKSGLFKAGVKAANEPLVVFFICALIYVKVNYLKENISDLIILIIVYYRMLQYIMNFQNQAYTFAGYHGSIQLYLETLHELSESYQLDGVLNQDFKKSINFEKVSFSYGEKQIFKNLDLTIPKNSSIAIVGPSGVGKSTFADLLTGVQTPGSGRILVDGRSLKEICKSEFRKQIGYVSQDSVIFNDSVANNISLWDERSDLGKVNDKIISSSKLAGCHEFVSGMEAGYESNIGEKGLKISGGQKQRIALARELYKDPQILILDEATSSLDTISEKAILNNLESLFGKITIIMIAHRLSTIKNCDKIVFLQDGVVKEQGRFDELLNKKRSLFSLMWYSQA